MLSGLFKKSSVPFPKNKKKRSAGDPVSVRGSAGSIPLRGPGSCLSVAAIERLAAHGHIKNAYPHVWTRICLSCIDPALLEKYLASLFIQARNGNRLGFRPEAMNEIADIQAANQRFLKVAKPDTPWSTSSTNR
jgi:hypothetical protein